MAPEKAQLEPYSSAHQKQQFWVALLQECEKYAKSKGIRLNPDKKIVSAIIKGLLKNEEVHGRRYCPCRAITGNKEEDEKSVCPCAYHMEEIKKQGFCRCRLFVKK